MVAEGVDRRQTVPSSERYDPFAMNYLLVVSNEKNYRRRRDALIDKKCNLDRRIVAVCRLELERVRPGVVRGSTAPLRRPTPFMTIPPVFCLCLGGH